MGEAEDSREHTAAPSSSEPIKIARYELPLTTVNGIFPKSLQDITASSKALNEGASGIAANLQNSYSSAIQTVLAQQEQTLKTISTLALPPTALSSASRGFNSIYDAIKKLDSKPDSNLRHSLSQMAQQLEEFYQSLTPSYFHSSNERPHYYSSEMMGPSSFFDPQAERIENIEDLNEAILLLQKHAKGLPLYWRGQNNADWGLHSKLFRLLMKQNGVTTPEARPINKQPYPTEDQMVQAEKIILYQARQDWRYGNMSALEIFARIQHFGGPTRLLDASCNPYIAAWFAVQGPEDENSNTDARLFALAGYAPGTSEQPDYSEELLQYNPFWFNLSDYKQRAAANWGTGSRRIVWKSPEYESRMAAQNAVFILDGVPITNSKILKYFPKPESKGYWKRPDVLASSSIYAKPFSPSHDVRTNKLNLAPTYSFVIAKTAKAEIRNYLEEIFGYRESFIYPDFSGLANKVNNMQFPGISETSVLS
ncbi:MAG: FRG domain-containing protein [Bifidobacteriaceae bacterium]|jgi:hypothetical protein|nr:FRG domain-containing protein [Bifidobacteriaceae bacterium]